MIPVGKDCGCGYPLVWRNGEQWCAVYGTHGSAVASALEQAAHRRELGKRRSRLRRQRLAAQGLTARGTPRRVSGGR